MRRSLVAALSCLIVAALAAGCGGSSHAPPAPGGPATPGTVALSYPRSGIAFRAPAGWRRISGRPPLIAVVQSGPATVAVWRYPRTEPLPDNHPSLVRAKYALLAAMKRRDPTFFLHEIKLLHVSTKRGVQVLGSGNVGGARRMIRATHVYTRHAEYVIQASAPPTLFARVDPAVFAPLLASLRFSAPQA